MHYYNIIVSLANQACFENIILGVLKIHTLKCMLYIDQYYTECIKAECMAHK